MRRNLATIAAARRACLALSATVACCQVQEGLHASRAASS